MHCVKLLRVDSITLQEYFVVLPHIHAIELQDVLCEIAEPRMHARLHLTHFNQSMFGWRLWRWITHGRGLAIGWLHGWTLSAKARGQTKNHDKENRHH